MGICIVVLLLTLYLAMLCIQLLPLKADLDDLIPTMTVGIVSALVFCTLMAMHGPGGLSFANPDGKISALGPSVLMLLMIVRKYAHRKM